MSNFSSFDINTNIQAEPVKLAITHDTESFDFTLKGNAVSLINNGDNSWSIVSGNISQEEANIIGQAIEDYLKDVR